MTADRPAEDRQTRRVRFCGHVQGVGFRYTTAGLAQACGIHGYVRNCPDGSVELAAQGASEDVDRFLARLGQHFAGYIDDQIPEDCDPNETFVGFDIRR
jgi:acylphosphatase